MLYLEHPYRAWVGLRKVWLHIYNDLSDGNRFKKKFTHFISLVLFSGFKITSACLFDFREIRKHTLVPVPVMIVAAYAWRKLLQETETSRKKQFAIETIENSPFAGHRRYRELQI